MSLFYYTSISLRQNKVNYSTFINFHTIYAVQNLTLPYSSSINYIYNMDLICAKRKL